MNAVTIWSNIKPYGAVLASIALWFISVIFFVVGFSFGTELVFFGNNVAMPVALAISLVNTVIQIVWNDERDDIMDWVLWGCSYVVGIASNIYGLRIILNMTDPRLELALAISLGAMIEIAPEKLLLKGLASIRVNFKFGGFGGGKRSSPSNRPNDAFRPAQQNPQKSGYQAQHKPALGPAQQQQRRPEPRPAQSATMFGEPTYHPVSMNSKSNNYNGE